MKPGTPQISIRSLQRKIRIDLVDLEKFVRKALTLSLGLPSRQKTDLQMLKEVSVLIVSDRKIACLHRRFMNEPGPTDVITFQHGEIFISAAMARRNARRFGTTLTGELRLYIVHGLLHLHGFDDRTNAGSQEMRLIQEKILTKAAV
jgi:probable rRNA maturation factor